MDIYILGLALYPAKRRVTEERLEEMVFSIARQALDDAGVERAEVDQVTLAACDELDGRSISSMLLAMPAGAYLRDEMKCTDSSLTGLCLGATRLAASSHGLGLVVSWSKTSIAPFEDVMRMRAEPFFTRPIGLNAGITDGLFAGAMQSAHGITETMARDAVLAYAGRAAQNPRSARLPMPSALSIDSSPYVAAPLRRGHCAPRTDGGAALVLATGDWLARHQTHTPRARLAGLGWSVDAYNLGRDRLTALKSFRDAYGRASAMADVEADELDVFELDCQTGYHAAAYETALDGLDPAAISPSGGAFAQNPYFCMGLVNAAEAILQLDEDAGTVQRPSPQYAAAHQAHGYAQQGNVVAIFEAA